MKKTPKPLPADECCDQTTRAEQSPWSPAASATPAKVADDHDHDHAHDHADERTSLLRQRWPLWLSLVILLAYLGAVWLGGWQAPQPLALGLMLAAYLLAGYKTIQRAFLKIGQSDFFNEFTLMTIATLGAFYIGEYSEGVAVMVFYEIGELFQDLAVSRAKRSIKALLDVRPDAVTVVRQGVEAVVHPSAVAPGEIIRVRPGEQVALDGTLLSPVASFNTAALTGESRPDDRHEGDPVLAGMINLRTLAEVRVTAAYADSKLSRILTLVQDATARKSRTQLMITRLAKIYTPVVFFLALAVTLLPSLWMEPYVFTDWLYRGMVFLVIACPCALTVSVPLGYFGGIGLASRNGILVKGASYLDVLTGIDTVVLDKTGTLTRGVFRVQQVRAAGLDEASLVGLTASLDTASTHPVARAVVAYAREQRFALQTPAEVEELPGFGLSGRVGAQSVLAGNGKLLRRFAIRYPAELDEAVETTVLVAVNGVYAGSITIADELKPDAAETIQWLKARGLRTVMLSGDRAAVVRQVARTLGVDEAHGDLLPEGKVERLQALKAQGRRLVFVGDGVNDAPVVALADAGIAMGGLGSDATIETADIVIQNDQLSRIPAALRVARLTRRVVWQNIALALGVKALVLLLGAGGVATLWEAIFADVGVALLAILNAVRIQRAVVSA